MDTIKSFKGYGKVDEAEEQAFKKKTRKRIIIVIVSTSVLLTIIIGVIVGIVLKKNGKGGDNDISNSPAAAVKAVCAVTQYQDTCYNNIYSEMLRTSNTTDPEKIFQISIQVALTSLRKLTTTTLSQQWKAKVKDPAVGKALDVCTQVFDDALDKLNDSISLANGGDEKILSVSKVNDIQTWLSSTITDQETCLDALEEVNATITEEVREAMKNSTELASNSLAIVAKIFGILGKFNIPVHGRRRLMGFPEWVGEGERRLLQEVKPAPNVTVAQDGSGDVKTLKEAFAKVTKKSLKRFVIYVKAGKYVENVLLDKSFWNVMIYGDGKTTTIISGSLNFVEGTPTFSTATFAVAGRGFIAKDIRFENTAGAAKHQAVAMRSGSDQSVFYRCSFDGYQDTLYAHSNRQFYRDCDITGTIDFIFGNAAVVFQNCNIQPRQPMANQFVTITAQGKKDPNQNTGISIQKCSMTPLDKLTASTYLGRPWKAYSTTIVMQTSIGPFLNPAGWVGWVNGVDPPSTIFYAEYQNTGPGANIVSRVKWVGYQSSVTANQASKYTVESFIEGSVWLPMTGVVFQTTL